MVSGNMFVILKTIISEKCSDFSMFSLPCIIRNRLILHALLDLRASINVMTPFSVFKNLELNNL